MYECILEFQITNTGEQWAGRRAGGVTRNHLSHYTSWNPQGALMDIDEGISVSPFRQVFHSSTAGTPAWGVPGVGGNISNSLQTWHFKDRGLCWQFGFPFLMIFSIISLWFYIQNLIEQLSVKGLLTLCPVQHCLRPAHTICTWSSKQFKLSCCIDWDAVSCRRMQALILYKLTLVETG